MIKTGDVVQKINNPEPLMTVERIEEDTAYVCWFEGSLRKGLKLKRDHFKFDSLKIYKM